METNNEKNMEALKSVFKVGGCYTRFHIGSCMAMTHKDEIKVQEIVPEGVVYTPRGKRKLFILRWETRSYASAPLQPLDCAIFEGWDQPITCDTDDKFRKVPGHCTTMRGNACYNFVAMPLEVAAWIESGQLNPFFDRTHVLAIEGDKETVVFPDEYKGGHAVIDRVLSNQSAA